MELDDKMQVMAPIERRASPRTNENYICLWHTATISYQRRDDGTDDKRSPLYKCIKKCDGQNPNCTIRSQLIDIMRYT